MDIDTEPGDGTAVLEVVGEVDLATAPKFRAEADALVRSDAVQRLVMDLSGVEFLDSSGIEMLSSIRNQCAERGLDLVLRAPRRRVVDLLRMTGLLDGFVVIDA